ncbi:FG-GAP repeat domain-containing protein [Fimbriiglobus ruber]|uniref:Alkaline phosphatase n=1 Tax=Fimbriiglobus ruber TaxID=1908690 RepID=A0A225DE76_9BACT|nr:VCBS repeat-containing protein [Fimbriiglobus ruber]OWK34427.1 Alkaline phosphatase [Fimbriiglobus ruber]
MSRMNWLLVILAAGVVVGPVVAQPPIPRPPVALRSFGLPNIPGTAAPPTLGQSSVGVLAAQLSMDVQTLRSLVTALPLAPQPRMTVSLSADQTARSAAGFQQLAARTGDFNQLRIAYGPLDIQVQQFIGIARQAAQQAVPGNVTVANAAARLQFSNGRLSAVLNAGNPVVDQLRAAIARHARELDEQADELRGVLDDFGGPIADRNLSRTVRTFGTRAGRLAVQVETGMTIDQARREFGDLSATWSRIAAALGPIAAVNPRVRIQATQVDAVVRELAAILGGPGIPGLPDPGFGIIVPGSRVFVVGAGDGGGPHVRVFHDLRGGTSTDFFPYDPNFRGGVRVAVADLNGDGFPDIVTAPGRGMPPLVRVFNGRDLSLLAEFIAYDAPFDLGVYVAAANITRDGRALVATGPGTGGGPHAKVFDLALGKQIDSFLAHPAALRAGLRVALGDVNGDGIPDLVTSTGPGNGPHIKVFNGVNRALISEFNAYDPRWTGGVYVATADITRNGRAEIITGTDEGETSVVKVFDAIRGQKLAEIEPYPRLFRGGVRVAAYDVNGDGVLDIICAPGPGAAMPVRMFDGRNRAPLGEFAPFPQFGGGAFIGSR